MTNKINNTKEQIQGRYGTIADHYRHSDLPLPLDIDGCVPQTKAVGTPKNVPLAERLYGQEELVDLPASVTNVSLGCGNPIAIANLKPGETVLDLGCGGGLDCFLAARADFATSLRECRSLPAAPRHGSPSLFATRAGRDIGRICGTWGTRDQCTYGTWRCRLTSSRAGLARQSGRQSRAPRLPMHWAMTSRSFRIRAGARTGIARTT